MTKKQNEFDRLYKGSGGIFDFREVGGNALLEKILASAEGFMQYLNRENPNLPIPYVDIINNDFLNALATRDRSHYFIGIHLGTIYLLKDLFYRMMSNKKVLPHIGNSKIELDPRIYNAQITSLSTLFVVKDEKELIVPQDTVRRDYADYLFSWAINFIIDHEYAHIINGHIDLISNSGNRFTLSEIESDQAKPPSYNLLRQTLEMDADSYAVNQGVHILFLLEKRLSTLGEMQHPSITTLEDLLFSWSFAIYSFFKMFDVSASNMGAIQETMHPPPAIRQAMVLGNLATILTEKHNNRLMNKFSMFSIEVASAVEQAFSDISEQEYNAGSFLSAFSLNSQKYVIELMKNWNVVRPLLEPIAANKKLAPLNKD